LPHILNESLNKSLDYKAQQDVARQYRHIFVTVGGIAKVSKNVKFKPSVMVKYVAHAPVQMDFNASFLFKEQLWVGASFRTSYNQPVAAVGMVEYMFAKCFRIGYAYDYTFTNIGKYTSGSHEIMLGYEFGKLSKYTTPRYMDYF
jgi:type IX secretion system PorP/SprF family membrane protein